MSATIKGSTASQQGSNPNNKFQVILPGASQKISTNGGSQQSSATGANCTIVRVFCDQDCFIAIGANPTAANTTVFLPANTVEYFGCNPADKVAAIQSSAPGNFFMTEGAS